VGVPKRPRDPVQRHGRALTDGMGTHSRPPGQARGRVANVLDVAERRLVRLGFDLHDGPLQDAAALLADVRALRDQLGECAPADALALLENVDARLVQLHDELRDLSGKLESRALVERSLREGLEREAASFRARCDIELDLAVEGDVSGLTASQRIATSRIVQEAMSNIREHSGARRAEVRVRADDDAIRVRVWDDGRGFVPGRATRDARRGRLGLLGMSERVRLLEGTLEVASAPGGPTVIDACLPRWRPAQNAADDRSAPAA
jgi:signal transduction histidine kinase